MKKEELLDAIVTRVPKAFFVEIGRRLNQVVHEASTSIRSDARFDKQEWSQMEGQMRYAMSFKQFRLAADAADIEWADYMTDRGGFHYPVVSVGPFVLTVSAIPDVQELPMASDYRTSLARAMNEAWSRPKLRDSDRTALAANSRPIYGIVTYTVTHATDTAGFIGIGFPADDYSEWIASFSFADLMDAYNRAADKPTKSVDDNVTPKIRRLKKDGDQG